jgi:hypothetical protein
MPEPLSPTIGFGIKVAVLPYEADVIQIVYFRICIQSARFTRLLNLVPISFWPIAPTSW